VLHSIPDDDDLSALRYRHHGFECSNKVSFQRVFRVILGIQRYDVLAKGQHSDSNHQGRATVSSSIERPRFGSALSLLHLVMNFASSVYGNITAKKKRYVASNPIRDVRSRVVQKIFNYSASRSSRI